MSRAAIRRLLKRRKQAKAPPPAVEAPAPAAAPVEAKKVPQSALRHGFKRLSKHVVMYEVVVKASDSKARKFLQEHGYRLFLLINKKHLPPADLAVYRKQTAT